MSDKIIEMKPVSMSEVREALNDRKAEKELNYEQEVTLKYVEKFSKLNVKQTQELLKELKNIEFLKNNDEARYQIVAALPTNEEQVKLFLPKDVTATDEELKTIVVLTKKYGGQI